MMTEKREQGYLSPSGMEGVWSRSLAFGLPLLFLAVCGCSDPVETTPPLGDSYYALSVITFGADGAAEGSIKFATSLDADAEVDEELTIESTGTAPLYSAESSDKLLNVLGKSGEIVKYVLAEDGTFQQDGEKIGFSGYGITKFRAPMIPIVSETQAYLWDDLTFATVRWNPSAMTIEKELPGVADLLKDKNLAPDGSYYWALRARYPLIVGKKVYQTICYIDPINIPLVLPHSGMLIVDTETDEVSYVDHPTCAGLENFMLAPDGYIYAASNSYAASNYVASLPNINAPCLVRFDPKTDTFDDSYQPDLSAAVGGKVPAGLVRHEGSSAYIKVFNDALFPPEKSLSSAADVQSSPAWEVYLIEDVASPTKVTAVDGSATSGLLYPFEVDGDFHVANVQYAPALKSSLFDMSTQPPTAGIEVDGITSFAIHLQR